MKIFLVTLVFMGLALLGMGLGVMLSGKRLKGSCGGLGSLGLASLGLGSAMNEKGERVCGVCGREANGFTIGSCEKEGAREEEALA
ncbi:MAG: hypothetical protein ACYTGZ_19590 [Planctomycetota bacterium]